MMRVAAVLGAGALLAASLLLWWQARDTTVYASDYSQQSFNQLRPGMALDEVYSILGKPLAVRREPVPERWCYDEAAMVRGDGGEFVVGDFLRAPPCVLFDRERRVLDITGAGMAQVALGMTADEVLELLGEPARRSLASVMTLHYTAPGGEGLFRARIVAVNAAGTVSDVISYQFYD